MSSPAAPAKKRPRATLLTGDVEARYVRDVTACLRAARLNTHYPDARALARALRCLGPEVHGGLYPGLQLDLRSGLPTYREWTRVLADLDIAAAALAEMKPAAELERRARAQPAGIYGKQLLKHRYYTRLLEERLAPLDHMEVALRRVDPDEQTAWFHVVLDKLDVSGVFVRYTIDLAQRDSVWNRRMVTLDEETAGHTQALRTLVYQFTSYDVELMHAKLVALGGLVVERVVKGSVGPIFVPGVEAPAPIAAMLQADGALVATFGLEMAACDLGQDRDNDPLDDLLAARLSEEARAGYEAARARYGYKVFKDRKLVVPRGLVPVAQAYCAAAGTRNIIYGI